MSDVTSFRTIELHHGHVTVRVVIEPSRALPEKYDRLMVFVDGPNLTPQDAPRWEMDVRHEGLCGWTSPSGDFVCTKRRGHTGNHRGVRR